MAVAGGGGGDRDVGPRRRWRELAARELQLVREAGALTRARRSPSARSIVALIFAGELAAAGSLLDEAKIVTEATGTPLAPYGALILAALARPRGRAADADRRRRSRRSSRAARASASVTTQWANALLHNGLGDYETRLGRGPARARGAAAAVTRRSAGRCPSSIEAAARCDQRRDRPRRARAARRA